MDILERYRNTLHFYFKIDFGLLAVIGSIITILKFQRNEIFSFIFDIKYIVLAVLIIICFSFLIETMISLVAGNIYEKKKELKNIVMFIRYSIVFLAFFHAGIFGFVGSYIVGYSEVNVLLTQEEAIFNEIRKDVVDFFESNYRLPSSIYEIYQKYPSVKRDIDDYDGTVLYEIKDSLSYEIIFGSSFGQHRNQASIVNILLPVPYNLKPIDDSISDFYTIYYRMPYSLLELKTLSKKTASLIDEYIKSGLHYLAIDSVSYELRYPGTDNSINTNDDIVSRKIIKLVYK